MPDNELQRSHQRIDDMLSASLGAVVAAIGDLERTRASLEADLEAHRCGRTTAESTRSAEGADRQAHVSGPMVQRERRRPIVAVAEPIGINRQSFQS